MPKLPPDTVRGRIRGWIEKHAQGLGDDVLEIGSRIHDPRAWWLVNRDLARGKWLGVDFQAGQGVDQVADVQALPEGWTGRFSGVLCSEVLEHVTRPWRAVPEMQRVLQPGGLLIVTTMQCFPLHGFPNDYYRYSESGLRTLLEDAGFVDIVTASAGRVEFRLDDHGGSLARRDTPMHVFAVASAPAGSVVEVTNLDDTERRFIKCSNS